MNEVTKLYSLAGVEPQKQCYYWDCPYSTGEVVLDLQKEKDCTNCKNPDKAVYPPFTAEKQLELIKFIASLGVCEIENWNDKGFYFAIKRERIYPTMFLSLSNINLQETLADVINNLWQDITAEERNQIKNILAEVRE